jgi:peroxiredoxin
MFKKSLLSIFAIFAISSHAATKPMAIIDQTAPDFALMGTDGKEYKLSQFKGKNVVLEWFNKDCPYVKKHYGSGNMQKLQKTYTAEGAVWLTIVSSAPKKQGHLTAAEGEALKKENNYAMTAMLLDPKGEVGKLYDAKTTPHMFIINKQGLLVYNGAIDDNSSANPKTIPDAKNHIVAAFADLKKTGTVTTKTNDPYGCSVKYN